jgi:hypothetical protein
MRSLRNVLAVLCGLVLLTLPDVSEAGRRFRLVPCQPVAAAVSQSEPTPVEPVSNPVIVRSHSREVHSQTIRECDGSTCRVRTVTIQKSEAQRRADELARRGQLGHFWPVSTLEGIGSGSSPEQATAHCCFWGQRSPREIGVAQGTNGLFYAVVFYD